MFEKKASLAVEGGVREEEKKKNGMERDSRSGRGASGESRTGEANRFPIISELPD